MTSSPISPTPTPAEQNLLQVQQAFDRFITAFKTLDWEPFRASFAPDVTFFFPFIHGRWAPYRANSLAEVEAVFKPFFANLRAQQGPSAHLRIDPVNLSIQLYNTFAIVTFHLEDEPGRLGRRTIILNRRRARWLIVHVHASIIEL